MIQVNEISGILLSAIAFLQKPAQEGIKLAVKDCYEVLKKKLLYSVKSCEPIDEAIQAVEKKPDSEARKLVLCEELEEAKLEISEDIFEKAKQLELLLKKAGAWKQEIHLSIKQSGKENSIQVAGRDIITTKKITKKNVIKTDERHIDGEQARVLKNLVGKHAPKFAGEDGKPDFRAVYRILYAEFDVQSYREILKEDFDRAVNYLQQLGARNRSKLKKSNPPAYRNDLFGAIYTKWKSLGYDKAEIYKFAEEKLSLTRQIKSLKQLGPNQLKWLNEAVDKEMSKKRRKKLL